ncbi:MAG: stage V sporulation protein AD [Clostridiales bacterium]|nr:stage V sporulation protein AD [Clostridiales bacterium]
MMKRKQTLLFKKKPYVVSAYSIVGEKEGEGPLNKWFDDCIRDNTYGETTWEKSESKMLKTAITEVIRRAGKDKSEIGAMLSGDLLNQLMSSSFMARDLHIPFLGMYGACSTMTESLMLGSVLTDGCYSDNVIVGASSHYCTAERQFRLPLEHGNQRPPSAQWTATASGAMLLSREGGEISDYMDKEGKVKRQKHVRVECGTIGKVIDAGVKDANQMGSAMAPAAVDTILNHLQDTNRDIDYYDAVLTGDLGFIGKDIVKDLLTDAGLSPAALAKVYDDCGAMIYTPKQDVHSGGSGCGCSASVFSGYIYKKMKKGKLHRALIISTGALLSTISPFQGESIPGIAHAIALEAE